MVGESSVGNSAVAIHTKQYELKRTHKLKVVDIISISYNTTATETYKQNRALDVMRRCAGNGTRIQLAEENQTSNLFFRNDEAQAIMSASCPSPALELDHPRVVGEHLDVSEARGRVMDRVSWSAVDTCWSNTLRVF